MRTSLWLVIAVLSAGVAVPRTARHPAPKTAEAAPVAGQDSSTLGDQVDLGVTVYNSDIALVRDVRDIQLPRGSFDLRFMDIAATINPATVHFRSLTEPARVSVVEQNYEYDLLEPEKLLRKYVGREVTLVGGRWDHDGTPAEVKARLLSYNTAPVWEIGGEIVTGMPATEYRFPELPGNLYSHPTMIWTLDNSGGTRHRVEASYLARKTTINNAETKQVSMLGATGFPVRKRYAVEGQSIYYRNAQHPGAPLKDVVQVFYEFKNEAKAGLGMPMPAGNVRVYQADSKG